MRPQITRHKHKSSQELPQSDRGFAEYLPKDTCQNDPHLTLVNRAWPDLPEAIRSGIVAMVKAASGRRS
jgi:hypothetical protein